MLQLLRVLQKKCSKRWKTMSVKEKGKFEDMAKAYKACYEREMKTYISPKAETKNKFKDPNAPKPSCSVLSTTPKSKVSILAYPLVMLQRNKEQCETAADDEQPYEKKAAKLKEKYENIAAYRAKGKPDAARKGVVKSEKSKKKKEEEDDKEDEEEEEEEDECEEDDDAQLVLVQVFPLVYKASNLPVHNSSLLKKKNLKCKSV
jgi:high mobility group protein B1